MLGLPGCGIVGGGSKSSAAALTVAISQLATGQVQQSYQATLAASGGTTPYSWSVLSGSLPPGLALTAATGQISGTPTQSGTFSFTLLVKDSGSPPQTASKAFSISIVPGTPAPLQITATSLPGGQVGTPYSATLTVTGGTTPYSWSIVAGALPVGLTLQASTGLISGTPSQSGTFSFTVQVQDSGSPVQAARQALSITVAAAPTPLQIATTSLANGQIGTAYSAMLTASGGTTPYNWSFAGSFPPGLALGASTGQISGTPTQSGTFSFTIQVKDSGSPVQTASQAFSISIVPGTPPPLQIATISLPAGQVSVTYSATVTASGGTTPYTWSIVSGSLPPGLTLGASTGQITGTPSQTGTFSFTVQVQDSGSPAQTATQVLSTAIGAAPVGTPVTACGVLANAGTTYVLQNDVSSTGSCFAIQANNITLNLNGHTVTYGTTQTALPVVFAVYAAACSDPNFSSGGGAVGNPCGGSVFSGLTVFGGTLTQGNCLNPSNSSIGSDVIHIGYSSGVVGMSFYNLTFNWCSDSAHAIGADYAGVGWSVHDNTFNDRVVTAQNRSTFQGFAVWCNDCQGQGLPAAVFYNNTFMGGPQGCIAWNQPSVQVHNNICNHGNRNGAVNGGTPSLSCEAGPYTNAAGTLPPNAGTQCSNDFGIQADGVNGSYYNNQITPAEGRGIEIYSASPGGGMSVTGNTITNAIEYANNAEYGGCELSGAYGIAFKYQPMNATASNNNVTVVAGACRANALGVSAADGSDLSSGNTYTAKRQLGSASCYATGLGGGGSVSSLPCAFAINDYGTAGSNGPFVSRNDTFVADTAILYNDWGATGLLLISPTFQKGTYNPDTTWHTFIARNGGSSATTHVRDATVGPGVSLTDVDIPAQSGNQMAASFYIEWTQTVTVTKSSGPTASGATVTYTDTLGNTYAGTTNASGVATVVVTQYRDNNDTGTNQVENRNPYSRSVSLPGCTTNTVTGLAISATGSASVTLAGC